MTVLVTGGSGFIGSNFIYNWLGTYDELVVNLDKQTYAAINNIGKTTESKQYKLVVGDIACDNTVSKVFDENKPRCIVHFAAESHVDNSIVGPRDFIETNINGTFNLLNTAYKYYSQLSSVDKNDFRFLHVSTDEVYGSLDQNDLPFTEAHKYAPNSPYSASKAASDHLVRAWNKTYALPTLISNCSNNYGPRQFPEKLIPKIITRALQGQSLPLYGDGRQVRDWLHVDDHCDALNMILNNGTPGETYNVGGNCEKSNIEIVKLICEILDDIKPRQDGFSYAEQIEYVSDRPGHDKRYAIDSSKITIELGWIPKVEFTHGLLETVKWYLAS